LLLEPGARPLEGWMEAVGAHAAIEMRPARFRVPGRLSRLLARLRGGRASPLRAGLLLTRMEARRASARARALEDVARGVRPVRLQCAIEPAPRLASGVRRAEA
jgi:hypothetical protein